MASPNTRNSRLANGVAELNRNPSATRGASLTIQAQLNQCGASARIAGRIRINLLQVHNGAKHTSAQQKESSASLSYL